MNQNALEERLHLIDSLRIHGIEDERVLKAMTLVPREDFVSDAYKSQAYLDQPLPIECNQTISQPYIVALMTQAVLEVGIPKTVLEVGTGSGYQAAILSKLIPEVYTVERIEFLYHQAVERFRSLGMDKNIHAHFYDGRAGWSEHAPYDAIIVTAASIDIPKELLHQLTDGGRLIIPVGESGSQVLLRIRREGDRFLSKQMDRVAFVPLLSGKEARDRKQ